MKLRLLYSLLLMLPLTVAAQLKVNSNGYTSFLTTANPLSPISINSTGDTDYTIYCKSLAPNGIYCTNNGSYGIYISNRADSAGVNSRYGIYCKTGTNNTPYLTGKSIGVYGTAVNSNNVFGVVGKLFHAGKGAGVLGCSKAGLTTIQEQHAYAGYFDGDVKITGDLTVAGSIDGVLLGRSSSSSPSKSPLLSSTSVADRIAGLSASAIKISKPIVERSEEVEDDLLPEEEWTDEEPEVNIVEDQYYQKNHFTLSADDLEKVFPDLVYEKADGTKGISYMEMIPLLVQSINELNAKIAQMSRDNVKQTRSAFSDDEDGFSSPATKNILYQNTPNPFKEQTTIRFSLADDVTSAAICIFDMSGKMLKKLPVSSGETSVTVNGWELGEGMFLYSLLVNGREIDTKKMIITK
jgi:hypothetical protein